MTSRTPEQAPESNEVTPATAYVWVWFPGHMQPVVAGAVSQTRQRFGENPVIAFVYARTYRERTNAISLFAPELPLREGTFEPRDLPSQPAPLPTGNMERLAIVRGTVTAGFGRLPERRLT